MRLRKSEENRKGEYPNPSNETSGNAKTIVDEWMSERGQLRGVERMGEEEKTSSPRWKSSRLKGRTNGKKRNRKKPQLKASNSGSAIVG